MSEQLDLLRRTVADVAATVALNEPADTDAAASELWMRLSEVGVTELDGNGGDGGTLADLLAVAEELGAAAIAVPYLSTCVVGRWAASRAGLAVPDGMLALATPVDGTGSVRWAGPAAGTVIVGADDHGEWRSLTVAQGAGSPLRRDVDGVARAAVATDAPGVTAGVLSPDEAEELQIRIVLGTACAMSGACRAALEAAVEHASTRMQFGRRILDFQAVRHELVVAHAEAHLARMALERAIEVAGHATGPVRRRAAAAALVRGDEAARQVARIAHQVHGAIGLTVEHDLWRWTMRLSVHRRAHTSVDAWTAELGASLLTAADPWELLTEEVPTP